MSRGLDAESAVALIVNGFAREVLKQLPMEFAVEAQKLLGISLEGSVDDVDRIGGRVSSSRSGEHASLAAYSRSSRDIGSRDLEAG